MKDLIIKVIKDGKLDENFKKAMTKEDAEITDLVNLFKKKKAKDIITLIKRWEYEQETDNSKKEKLVKVIKMNMTKKKVDVLTDKEITEGLYKLAVSEYQNKNDSEIATWEKGETNNDEQTPAKSFLEK